MQDSKRVKNPRKQRKMVFNAPAHIRHKFMSAPLSSELRASRGTRTLPVRKGDTVRIERGDNKGFEGKVSRVDTRAYRIYLEGLTREKVDGTNIFLPIHPSKVQIRNLNLTDNWRKDILGRKKQIEKPEKEEKPKIKPTKKAEKALEKPKAEVKELEEERIEAPPAKEEALHEEKPSEVPQKVPSAKKAPARKTAAKRPAAKEAAKEEEVSIEEKVPVKKAAAKPKTAVKKTAVPKEAPAEKKAEKKPVSKPRAKRKASQENEGG